VRSGEGNQLLGSGVLDVSLELNVNVFDVAGNLKANCGFFLVSELESSELLSKWGTVNIFLGPQDYTCILELVKASLASIDPDARTDHDLSLLANQDGLFNHEEFALECIVFLLPREFGQLGKFAVL
jgi:hypothetical protein